jgi:hypothetical protein
MNVVTTYVNLGAADSGRQEDLRASGLQEIAPVWLPGGEHDMPPHLGWLESGETRNTMEMT